MGYFNIPSPLLTLVFAAQSWQNWCTYRIWQVFSKITKKFTKMTSLQSYDVTFCFRPLVSFRISEFFISWPIWLKFGSGDAFKAVIPNMERYSTLEANIKPILAIFLSFFLRKNDRQSLTLGLPWQQIKPEMNETYIFGCSVHVQ